MIAFRAQREKGTLVVFNLDAIAFVNYEEGAEKAVIHFINGENVAIAGEHLTALNSK